MVRGRDDLSVRLPRHSIVCQGATGGGALGDDQARGWPGGGWPAGRHLPSPIPRTEPTHPCPQTPWATVCTSEPAVHPCCPCWELEFVCLEWRPEPPRVRSVEGSGVVPPGRAGPSQGPGLWVLLAASFAAEDPARLDAALLTDRHRLGFRPSQLFLPMRSASSLEQPQGYGAQGSTGGSWRPHSALRMVTLFLVRLTNADLFCPGTPPRGHRTFGRHIPLGSSGPGRCLWPPGFEHWSRMPWSVPPPGPSDALLTTGPGCGSGEKATEIEYPSRHVTSRHMGGRCH